VIGACWRAGKLILNCAPMEMDDDEADDEVGSDADVQIGDY